MFIYLNSLSWPSSFKLEDDIAYHSYSLLSDAGVYLGGRIRNIKPKFITRWGKGLLIAVPKSARPISRGNIFFYFIWKGFHIFIFIIFNMLWKNLLSCRSRNCTPSYFVNTSLQIILSSVNCIDTLLFSLKITHQLKPFF